MPKIVRKDVKVNYRWFTGRVNGITSEIVTDVKVCAAYHPEEDDERPTSVNFKALWDTGASTTLVSPKVVSSCGLKPIGVMEIGVVREFHRLNSYLANIVLSNSSVEIGKITVGCAELPGETDVLIGMDIITLGDFAITNVAGKTVFSFRIPSLVIVDFGLENPVVKPVLLNIMEPENSNNTTFNSST